MAVGVEFIKPIVVRVAGCQARLVIGAGIGCAANAAALWGLLAHGDERFDRLGGRAAVEDKAVDI